MPDAVRRMLTLLCTLFIACPIGTNLSMLWMPASGRLLGARGALFPGLADCGLSAPATRRAWAALGQDALLPRAEVWADLVRPDAAADGPTITVLAIHDPRHREPLLLATSLSLAPRATATATAGRWSNSPWRRSRCSGPPVRTRPRDLPAPA